MIKLILMGGLGNQMFQYAAARALSLKCGCDLGIDLHMFERSSKVTPRSYELDVFQINPLIVSSFLNEISTKVFRRSYSNLVYSLLDVFSDAHPQAHDERFSCLKNDTTLLGYFQNEEYFKDFETQIRADFIFNNKLEGVNLMMKKQIKDCNSVSLHIRRTDYLNVNSNLKVLDMDYYKKAISLLKSEIENPCFFIFSDDIKWVENNLDCTDLNVCFVDFNKGDRAYIDMQLMSLCKHNIIANSSFSWWGAWLNNNLTKKVIAPSMWYKNQIENNYPEGFIPKAWIIL